MSAGTPQEDVALVREALEYWSETAIGSEEEREQYDGAVAALDRLEQRLARLEEAARPFSRYQRKLSIGGIDTHRDVRVTKEQADNLAQALAAAPPEEKT